MIHEDVEYEVVWNGGELLPPRDSKPSETWQAPKRLYKKTAPEGEIESQPGSAGNMEDDND